MLSTISFLNDSNFTFLEYIWAVSVLLTRQNEIPYFQDKKQFALIPLWDMINHEEGKFATFYDEKSKSNQMVAQRNFKKKKENKF